MDRFTLQKGMFTLCIFISIIISQINCSEDNSDDKDGEDWRKKDVRDYSDADLERLFDQWEDNDPDELEEDELPEWKRPSPKIDMSQFDPNDPESMLKMSKKGRTLMIFASISGNPTEKETETISQLWQGSLFNAHIDAQRYVVGSNRVLFMLKDGAAAWEVKDFLVEQERCEVVTIEGKDYPGRGAASQQNKDDNKTSKKTDKKKKKTKQTKQESGDKKRDESANEIKKRKVEL